MILFIIFCDFVYILNNLWFCLYFYISQTINNKKKILESLSKEIILQKNFLKEPVKSIYFGGGTPSILEPKEIQDILLNLKTYFDLGNYPRVKNILISLRVEGIIIPEIDD